MKKSIIAVAIAAVLVACSGNGSKLTKGNLSKMDTLSYALGANIGTGINYQMNDIPFDVAAITKGIEEGAFEKAPQTHEEAIDQLRDYFMTKRGARQQEIAKKRAEADSIRLAEGDTTKVEYPVADEAMFESEEEREALHRKTRCASNEFVRFQQEHYPDRVHASLSDAMECLDIAWDGVAHTSIADTIGCAKVWEKLFPNYYED